MLPPTDLNGIVKEFAAGANVDGSGDPLIVTAAGATDGVKVTGKTIDLGTDLDRPQSGVLVVTGVATLAATETLSLAAEYQESDDGSSWDTAVALYAATVVATGETGGSTGLQYVKADHLKVKPLKQFVRFNVTPDMSASGTDTSTWAAAFVGGGMRRVPTT